VLFSHTSSEGTIVPMWPFVGEKNIYPLSQKRVEIFSAILHAYSNLKMWRYHEFELPTIFNKNFIAI